MTRIVLVSGTWGAKWAADGTPFRRMLADAGVEVVLPPFEWSEDVSGIPSFFTGGKHSDWKAGGFAFGLFMDRIPFGDRIVLAHSYGGSVVAYGLIAATAVPIRRLITVGTPYREDMEPVWAKAKARCGYHVHVCDPKPPFIERIAQAFDGRFSPCPQVGHPTADVVIKIPKMKHTRILDDAAFVDAWVPRVGNYSLLEYVTAPKLEGERNVAGVV